MRCTCARWPGRSWAGIRFDARYRPVIAAGRMVAVRTPGPRPATTGAPRTGRRGGSRVVRRTRSLAVAVGAVVLAGTWLAPAAGPGGRPSAQSPAASAPATPAQIQLPAASAQVAEPPEPT